MSNKLANDARKAATAFVLGHYGGGYADGVDLTRAKLGVMALAARPSVSTARFAAAGALTGSEGRRGTVYENQTPKVLRSEIHDLTDLLTGFAQDQQPKKKKE